MKANNKYMSNYSNNVISSYLMDSDANNLYGSAMVNNLPYGNFKWSNDIKSSQYILNYNPETDVGYFLDVNLHYPKHLHDYHSLYPLAPENTKVTADMVSEFSNDIYKEYHKGKSIKDEQIKKK